MRDYRERRREEPTALDIHDISTGHRILLFVVACTHVLLASGECYGWTALRPVLLKTGLFASFDEETRNNLMNTLATMGIAANSLCKLPLGHVLDTAGPRSTATLGAAMVIVGSVLMGSCGDDDQNLPILGFFMLGMAGPFLQMPCFQFSELFGSRRATAMAYLITCFELSTGVFWVFGVLCDNYGLTRKQLFMGYAGVGAYCFVTASLLWPDLPYRSLPPSTQQKPGPPKPGQRAQPAPPAPPPASIAPPNRLHPLVDKPLLTQVFSIEFLYVVLFLTIHIFRQGFLLGTLGPQVEAFFPDKSQADMLKSLFNVILPLGFLPMMFCTASGLAGFILNRPRLAFVLVTLISMVYGGLLLVHNTGAYITLFVIYPVARQFVFSTFFSFSANTFGYGSFGRIAGVASTVAGLVQLSQTKLVEQIESPTSPDLTWAKVDLLLFLLPVVLLLYPFASWAAELSSYNSRDDLALLPDDNSEHDDYFPLLPPERSPDRSNEGSREMRGMLMPGREGPEVGLSGSPAGAPISMSYAEASSYGSQSASSLAAFYSHYVSEDVKVTVARGTEPERDRSLHVPSFGESPPAATRGPR